MHWIEIRLPKNFSYYFKGDCVPIVAVFLFSFFMIVSSSPYICITIQTSYYMRSGYSIANVLIREKNIHWLKAESKLPTIFLGVYHYKQLINKKGNQRLLLFLFLLLCLIQGEDLRNLNLLIPLKCVRSWPKTKEPKVGERPSQCLSFDMFLTWT